MAGIGRVNLLSDAGFSVHLAHPSGNDWGQRRVKNDERDAQTSRICCGWVAWRRRGSLRPQCAKRVSWSVIERGWCSEVHERAAHQHGRDGARVSRADRQEADAHRLDRRRVSAVVLLVGPHRGTRACCVAFVSADLGPGATAVSGESEVGVRDRPTCCPTVD